MSQSISIRSIIKYFFVVVVLLVAVGSWFDEYVKLILINYQCAYGDVCLFDCGWGWVMFVCVCGTTWYD